MANRIAPGSNGCIEWTGFKSHLGYGHMAWGGRDWMVHRLVYAAHHGPFDPWLDIRHACDNPGCVNIAHLSLGTRSDNMRDAVDRQRAKNSQKTTCPRGHAYDAEWLPRYGTYKKWRRCKICDRGRQRVYAGWPEHLAFDPTFIVPNGYALDLATGQIVPSARKRWAKRLQASAGDKHG
jgi:hypothetical protein